jgi:NADH-quinone oxidoreductase subunit H
MLTFVLISVIKVVVTFVVLLGIIAYVTLLERRALGFFQSRLGPNRVGFQGILQPVADGIKLIFKEDIVPAQTNKVIHTLAPVLVVVPALIIIGVIPFGPQVTLFGHQIDMVISDLNVGLLYIFAVAALGIYGIILGGWSSNNKYSLLGGLRSSAQMISYEASLGLSIVGILMIANSLSLVDIVNSQNTFLNWFVFRQPLGFILFLVCTLAESNRAPFDLPEAENELVAGFHTEYSGLKFGMFYIGEYGNMVNASAIATTLFFGGWQGPVLPPVIWFLVKLFAFLFLFIWIRATLPRFRYDQLMRFGWGVLLPLALLNILITGIVLIL